MIYAFRVFQFQKKSEWGDSLCKDIPMNWLGRSLYGRNTAWGWPGRWRQLYSREWKATEGPYFSFHLSTQDSHLWQIAFRTICGRPPYLQTVDWEPGVFSDRKSHFCVRFATLQRLWMVRAHVFYLEGFCLNKGSSRFYGPCTTSLDEPQWDGLRSKELTNAAFTKHETRELHPAGTCALTDRLRKLSGEGDVMGVGQQNH